MLYLRHEFYNIISKIEHKLHVASGSAPSETFWVRTCSKVTAYCELSGFQVFKALVSNYDRLFGFYAV